MRELDERSANILSKVLQKRLYVIFTDPSAPGLEHRKLMAEHLDYQISLERRGVMFGAGPFIDEEGRTDGYGMIIVRASSMAEAEEIARQDPLHKSGLRTYRIQPWMLNEGRITIALNYSDQTFTIE